MNKNANIPTSFQDALTLLGDAASCPVDRNTILLTLPGGSIGLQFHRTVVLRYQADGTFVLDAAGFRTSTTKERMNQALPAGFRIFQRDHEWNLQTPLGDLSYFDGMIVSRAA